MRKFFIVSVFLTFLFRSVSSLSSGVYVLSLVSDGRELYSQRVVVE